MKKFKIACLLAACLLTVPQAATAATGQTSSLPDCPHYIMSLPAPEPMLKVMRA